MRRPTALDREIADVIRQLPIGEHMITVEAHGASPILKAEGSAIFVAEDRRFIIVPMAQRAAA